MSLMIEHTPVIRTAWLGDHPPHWQLLSIKSPFRQIDSRSETGEEELLSGSHHTGISLKRDSLENEDDHLGIPLSQLDVWSTSG